MTGVELIVAALTTGAAAGAGKGAKDTAATMIGDLYQGLKRLVTGRLGDRTAAKVAVEADHTEPAALRSAIAPALVESGADTDHEILARARTLLAQLEAPAAKYAVDNRGAKGVVIGDHSSQTNHFH